MIGNNIGKGKFYNNKREKGFLQIIFRYQLLNNLYLI